jgi:hypothetical protein
VAALAPIDLQPLFEPLFDGVVAVAIRTSPVHAWVFRLWTTLGNWLEVGGKNESIVTVTAAKRDRTS